MDVAECWKPCRCRCRLLLCSVGIILVSASSWFDLRSATGSSGIDWVMLTAFSPSTRPPPIIRSFSWGSFFLTKLAQRRCRKVAQVDLVLGVLYVLNPLLGYWRRGASDLDFKSSWRPSSVTLSSFDGCWPILVKHEADKWTVVVGERRCDNAEVLWG